MRKTFQFALILTGINVSTIPQGLGQTTLDRRVDSLLSLMTLEEKIGQMNQYNGFWDVTRPAPFSWRCITKI